MGSNPAGRANIQTLSQSARLALCFLRDSCATFRPRFPRFYTQQRNTRRALGGGDAIRGGDQFADLRRRVVRRDVAVLVPE